MPIKFRCKHCRQFLGISQLKAGAVVDCPTCGRSIRVPQLDGRVDPLPEPELNLDDSELVQALDALAAIGEDPDAQSPQSDPVVPGPEESEIPLGLAPQPEPILVAPPMPAEPASAPDVSDSPHVAAVSTASQSDQVSTSSNSAQVPNGTVSVLAPQTTDANDSVDPLAALASIGRPEQRHFSKSSGKTRGDRSIRNILTLTLAFVLLLIVFVLGYFVGQRGRDAQQDQEHPVGNGSQTLDGSDSGPGRAHRQAALGRWVVAIRGRITYKSSSGESRPDHDARLIAFPKTKQGQVKLSCVGFRPGDLETDLQVAAAAMKSLGGNVAVVDEHGNYELELPQAGKYRLLVLSHFQKRDDSIDEDPSLQRLLQQFFDRAPDQLLGTVQYEFTELFYNGERVNVWDHSFVSE